MTRTATRSPSLWTFASMLCAGALALGCATFASTPAWAQSASSTDRAAASRGHRAPLPTLTYQAPSSETTYSVTGGPPGNINAYQYSVPSGTSAWTRESTVTWRYVDIATTNNVVPGTYYGRVAYQFYLDQSSCPWWGCPPRVEFDSASPTDQNAQSPSGVGTVAPGTEQFYVWSVYFPGGFDLNQRWAVFMQFHPGGNYESGAWPGLDINGDVLFFAAPGGSIDINGNPAIWSTSLSSVLGTWIDFAMHAKWSTGNNGLIELYVNGSLVATQGGPNFYIAYSGTPFYYVKQGYYRDGSITSHDDVYQTPMLVTAPTAGSGALVSLAQ